MGRKRVGVDRRTEAWLDVLGDLVREARIERSWRQVDLASRIGTSVNTVAAIEKGSPAVSVGIVLHAASILDIPIFGIDDTDQARRTAAHAAAIRSLLPRRVDPARPVAPENDRELDF